MAWKPDYVALNELKNFARISDTDDDTELGFAISTASRAVDNTTNRQFGKVDAAEARYYTAKWDRELRRYVVTIDDLMTETDLVIKTDIHVEGTYDETLTDYRLRPLNAEQKGKPWTKLILGPEMSVSRREGGVEVTAIFGWTEVPDAIKQATLLQANRLHARRFSPFGIAGSPDQGSELRLLSRLDPDVAVSVKDYVRWWAAA
jgi:hypothetical protein